MNLYLLNRANTNKYRTSLCFFAKSLAISISISSVIFICFAVSTLASSDSEPTVSRTRGWDSITHTLGGVPERVYKIEYAGSIFYLGSGVTKNDFLTVIAVGPEAVRLHTPPGIDRLYLHPVYILWNADKTVLLVHPIIFPFDDVLDAVAVPINPPASLTITDEKPKIEKDSVVFFDKLTLLSNNELAALMKTAPSHDETRSAITMTNRAMNDVEFAAWTAEYFELGDINSFELEVIKLINEERAKHGLKPLAIMPHYMQAARFRSQEMIDLNYFSHTSPVYGDVGAIIFRLGTNMGRSENIVFRRTPEETVNAWLNSTKGHRQSLLSSTAAAIGVGHSGGMTTALLISEDNLRAYLESRMG